MHPNVRYRVATVTVPGFSPASAERCMSELGFAHVPNRSTLMGQRKEITKEIHQLAKKSMNRTRQIVAEKAIDEGRYTEELIGGKKVASIFVLADGNGSKRSYNSCFTGEGLSGALLSTCGKVLDVQYLQNNDRNNGFRNHKGSVGTAETTACNMMG